MQIIIFFFVACASFLFFSSFYSIFFFVFSIIFIHYKPRPFLFVTSLVNLFIPISTNSLFIGSIVFDLLYFLLISMFFFFIFTFKPCNARFKRFTKPLLSFFSILCTVSGYCKFCRSIFFSFFHSSKYYFSSIFILTPFTLRRPLLSKYF